MTPTPRAELDPCSCHDYKIGIANLTQVVTAARKEGQIYTGPFFRFCPYCGTQLSRRLSRHGTF